MVLLHGIKLNCVSELDDPSTADEYSNIVTLVITKENSKLFNGNLIENPIMVNLYPPWYGLCNFFLNQIIIYYLK